MNFSPTATAVDSNVLSTATAVDSRALSTTASAGAVFHSDSENSLKNTPDLAVLEEIAISKALDVFGKTQEKVELESSIARVNADKKAALLLAKFEKADKIAKLAKHKYDEAALFAAALADIQSANSMVQLEQSILFNRAVDDIRYNKLNSSTPLGNSGPDMGEE